MSLAQNVPEIGCDATGEFWPPPRDGPSPVEVDRVPPRPAPGPRVPLRTPARARTRARTRVFLPRRRGDDAENAEERKTVEYEYEYE